MSLYINTSAPSSRFYTPPSVSPGGSSEEEDDEAIETLQKLHEIGDDKDACVATVSTASPFDSAVRYNSRFHVDESYDQRGYTYFSFKPDPDSMSLCVFQQTPSSGNASRLKIIVQDKELEIRRVLVSNSLWMSAESGGALSINGRVRVIARPLTSEDITQILARASDYRSQTVPSPDPEVMEYMIAGSSGSGGGRSSLEHMTKIEEIKLRCLFNNTY